MICTLSEKITTYRIISDTLLPKVNKVLYNTTYSTKIYEK